MTPIRRDHELHRRRFGRNLGLGLALGAFVLLVFGLTIVKVGKNPPHAHDSAVSASSGTTP